MKAVYDDIMMMKPRYETLGENLFWVYAVRQAIATVVNSGEMEIGKRFYVYRSLFYGKFKDGKQKISDFYDVNKRKFQADSYCFYCQKEIPKIELTADHVFPRCKGGTNDMDNIIFVCKNCNSSKGKLDLIEWFLLYQDRFPPTFVLGHYLRQIYAYAMENDLMGKRFEEVCQMQLPFNPRSILLLCNGEAVNYYFKYALQERGID